jgi:outer membrane protein TolC
MLLMATAFAKAAPPKPLRLTLRGAAEMALKQNPQMQIANLIGTVTQENQIVARSALLPQANPAVFESVQRETHGIAGANPRKTPPASVSRTCN